MARFICTKYPSLRIGGVARFTDGVCETDNPAALEQLRRFVGDEEYGITEEPASEERAAKGGGRGRKRPEAPESVPKERAPGERADPVPAAPARSASKADWVAYAVACGADVEEAEGLTRDQLVEEYGDLTPGE